MYKGEEKARACQRPCVFRKPSRPQREVDRQYHGGGNGLGLRYRRADDMRAALFTTFGSNREACCGESHGKSLSSAARYPEPLPALPLNGEVGIHVL